MNNQEMVKRIMSRVRASTLSCWEWTGSRSASGYGRVNVGGRVEYAHRLMYEAINGPLDAGLFVCHTCDNPSCCNPDHLFAGTHEQNMRDSVRKERHARGEKNGHSVLTGEQVLVIRADGRTLEQVAADYGISASHVCAIQRGTFWRHLPGARAAKIPRLGEGDIAQIKARHTGKYGCGAALAREFGVSQSYISWIVRHG